MIDGPRSKRWEKSQRQFSNAGFEKSYIAIVNNIAALPAVIAIFLIK